MDRRRFLLTSLAGALAGPLAAEGQQAGKVARIGFLGNQNPKEGAASLSAFRQGLRERGWVEGQNIAIEYRWADGNLDRHPMLVADLVKLSVDVIVLAGTSAVRAVRQATSTIPVVSAIMADPVPLGLVASLARPGGNITGLAIPFGDIVTKQLQMLKETLPKATRVTVLTASQVSPSILEQTEVAARTLGVEVRVRDVRSVSDLDVALKTAKTQHTDAVHVLPSPFFNRHRARLAQVSLKYGLPAISETRDYVEAGGLMSYGPNFHEMYRRAADYVDRILKGARPGDLPIEQPTRFELVINRRAVNALGLTIPPSVLAMGAQLIE
jgi:putative tryptophan/tyrosine transport system substrate-binding protein